MFHPNMTSTPVGTYVRVYILYTYIYIPYMHIYIYRYEGARPPRRVGRVWRLISFRGRMSSSFRVCASLPINRWRRPIFATAVAEIGSWRRSGRRLRMLFPYDIVCATPQKRSVLFPKHIIWWDLNYNAAALETFWISYSKSIKIRLHVPT